MACKIVSLAQDENEVVIMYLIWNSSLFLKAYLKNYV